LFILLPIELLAQILFAGAGVALVELIVGAFAMVVPVPLHGHKDRNVDARDGVEMGGQKLGGGAVTADVGGRGRKTQEWI
jgi:hypothetical protein